MVGSSDGSAVGSVVGSNVGSAVGVKEGSVVGEAVMVELSTIFSQAPASLIAYIGSSEVMRASWKEIRSGLLAKLI